MNPFVLSLKSLRHRKFTVVLSVLTIGLSTMLLLGVERLRHEARTGFENTLSGVDLIVGSRSGSISLLLYSVFHVGGLSQNVSYETYEEVRELPEVAWTIPIALGDSHGGFPVLGTHSPYFKYYRYGRKQSLIFAAGESFDQSDEAVIGSAVAARLGYQLGDQVILSHGTGPSFVHHDEHPFTIVGILKPTGTPVDQTVHIALSGLTAVHAEFGGQCDHDLSDPLEAALHKHEHSHGPTNPDLSAFMVGLKDRSAVLGLQRYFNTYEKEPLTAIMPTVALQELWQIIGTVERLLRIVSIFVLLVAMAGVLMVLLTSLNERRREMAILRSVGARPVHIVSLIFLESFFVTLGGLLSGVTMLYVAVQFVRPWLAERFGLLLELGCPTLFEITLMIGVLLLGILTGLIPAIRCYRNSLADGLTVKM